jgi:Ca-activated chloride channel family protein
MNMQQEAILKSVTGERIALQSVHVEGQLDGLLLSTTIRQEYHNDTGKNLEIVYTFPIGWGTTLLGMDTEIGGKRLQGVVIEKKEAEEKYEEALDKGDTPVMVQQSAPGLYTANLGNIKADESIAVEIRCAQLLRFEQGRIRVKIPTVIAPRYGDAHKEGGLAPHETDAVDFKARYPLTISLNIHGEAAKAAMSSPSHAVDIKATDDSVSVLLKSGAMLDRDFILLLEGLEGHSFALTAKDGDQHMALASFCPRLSEKDDPLLLKILVDCSGSMMGDSIFQAKGALGQILREVKEGDYLSYSRFGSNVQHETEVLRKCSEKNLQRLSRAVEQTDANMGGTAMESALASTFKDVKLPDGNHNRPCLLLITDDLYWNSEAMIQSCAESGHRIFTIGVGSAPAENLLRTISEKTGGACEFVMPNENIAAAIVRMFHRMRVAQTGKLRIVWGKEPLWQSPLPRSVFDGETLHLFATFAEEPTAMPELVWEVDGQPQSAKPESFSRTENPHLARLGGFRRMETSADKQESLELALKYQLVSSQTSLFLVYPREGEDKVTELPELHQVPQMMAAGSHGYGSVKGVVSACSILGSVSTKFFAHSKSTPVGKYDKSVADLPWDEESTSSDPVSSQDAATSPQDLLALFDRQALACTDFAKVFQGIIVPFHQGDPVKLIARLAKQEGISEEQALAILLDWLLAQLADVFTSSRQAKRLLRAQLRGIDASHITAVRGALAVEYPSVSLYAWAA